MSVPFARDGMSVPFARDGMSVPFTRRDDIMACPLLTVRTERRGGSAATDADVEVRHNLFTLAPGAPFFDVSLPPSSVGFAQNERNTRSAGGTAVGRGSTRTNAGVGMVLAAALVVAAGCQAQPRGSAPLAVVGDDVVLRWDDPLPARSAIFDGEVVRLRGARGEVLGVQVLRAGVGAAPVALTVEGLAVTGFAVDHHDVRRPSTAMYGGSRGAGRYPDRLTPVDGAVTAARAAFFDVAIGRDAGPGLHRGELVVGDVRIPVEVAVADVAMPDLAAAPRVWAYYNPGEVRRAHGVDDTLALERGYAALFRAHGVVASPELTAESWAARRDLVAGLPFVPVLLPRERSALEAEVAGWVARLAGTGQVGFAIPIDEPRAMADQLRVRELAGWVRAAGGGPGRFLLAVTHQPTWALGDEVDVYISPFAVRAGQRRAAWTYNGTPPWAGSMVLDAAAGGPRTWGWIGFRYGVPLWYVWDALYWRDRHNAGRDTPGHDLVADPISFDDGGDHGNLDGVLAFPGPLASLRLKALRRGQQDRALLEALAACAGADAAQAIARDVVPRALGEVARGERPTWPATDVAWEAARGRVLDALAGCPR